MMRVSIVQISIRANQNKSAAQMKFIRAALSRKAIIMEWWH